MTVVFQYQPAACLHVDKSTSVFLVMFFEERVAWHIIGSPLAGTNLQKLPRAISVQDFISRGRRGDQPIFDPETTFFKLKARLCERIPSIEQQHQAADLPIYWGINICTRPSLLDPRKWTCLLHSPEARSQPTWSLRFFAQSQAPSFRVRKTAATSNCCSEQALLVGPKATNILTRRHRLLLRAERQSKEF